MFFANLQNLVYPFSMMLFTVFHKFSKSNSTRTLKVFISFFLIKVEIIHVIPNFSTLSLIQFFLSDIYFIYLI